MITTLKRSSKYMRFEKFGTEKTIDRSHSMF